MSSYHVLPFPAARQIVVDAGDLGLRRHLIHGFLEFDVTRPRQLIRDYAARTGETPSFTAFVVGCFAQAIAVTPLVQAYRDWRNRLVVFHDVDVVVLVETEAGGVALPHIIRAVNRKSYSEINCEIRSIQSRPAGGTQSTRLVQLAPYLPRWVRNLYYWTLLWNPHWLKEAAGTVVVTAVGMFGRGAGWGLGFLPMHTLGLTIGGIVEKPAVIGGQIVVRECLSLTISLDHDIVDGAPAARFAQRFRELVESGYGLCGEPR